MTSEQQYSLANDGNYRYSLVPPVPRVYRNFLLGGRSCTNCNTPTVDASVGSGLRSRDDGTGAVPSTSSPSRLASGRHISSGSSLERSLEDREAEQLDQLQAEAKARLLGSLDARRRAADARQQPNRRVRRRLLRRARLRDLLPTAAAALAAALTVLAEPAATVAAATGAAAGRLHDHHDAR